MKKHLKNIFFIIYGLIMLTILVTHMANFTYPTWVYEDLVEPYVGTNIISGWTDLLFFTYWALILFALWLILCGFSKITNNTKLINFCSNKRLITIITCNEIATLIIYTIFQVATNGDFGYYGNSPSSWWSLIENIIVHYIFTLSALWLFFKQPKKSKMCFKDTLYVLIMPTIYMVTSAIVCNTCLPIRWYPYPICAPDTLWTTIFGTMIDYNTILAWVILIISYIFIMLFFLGIGIILKAIHNHLYNKAEKVILPNKNTI